MDQVKRFKAPSLYKNSEIKDLISVLSKSSIGDNSVDILSSKVSNLKLASKTRGVSKKITETKNQLKSFETKNKKSLKNVESIKKSLADENKRILALLDSLKD
jgi:hypothetical protein